MKMLLILLLASLNSITFEDENIMDMDIGFYNPDSTSKYLEIWRDDSLGCKWLRYDLMIFIFIRDYDLYSKNEKEIISILGTPNERTYLDAIVGLDSTQSGIFDKLEPRIMLKYYYDSYCSKDNIPYSYPVTYVYVTFDLAGLKVRDISFGHRG